MGIEPIPLRWLAAMHFHCATTAAYVALEGAILEGFLYSS